MNRPPVAHTAAMLLAALAAAPAAAQGPAGKGGQPEGAGKPHLIPVWKFTAIGLPKSDDFNAHQYTGAQEWVAARYAEVLKDRRAAGKPEIPPAVPVPVGDLVVYNTDRGIVVRTLRPVQVEGEPPIPGRLVWESQRVRGLVPLYQSDATRRMTLDWVKRYQSDANADPFFHRTLSTGFTVSHGYVYFVDELGLLPPAALIKAGYGFGPLDLAVRSNMIKVCDLAGGKLVMKLPDDLPPRPQRPPAPHHFLSAPLADGHLWFIPV